MRSVRRRLGVEGITKMFIFSHDLGSQHSDMLHALKLFLSVGKAFGLTVTFFRDNVKWGGAAMFMLKTDTRVQAWAEDKRWSSNIVSIGLREFGVKEWAQPYLQGGGELDV